MSRASPPLLKTAMRFISALTKIELSILRRSSRGLSSITMTMIGWSAWNFSTSQPVPAKSNSVQFNFSLLDITLTGKRKKPSYFSSLTQTDAHRQRILIPLFRPCLSVLRSASFFPCALRRAPFLNFKYQGRYIFVYAESLKAASTCVRVQFKDFSCRSAGRPVARRARKWLL